MSSNNKNNQNTTCTLCYKPKRKCNCIPGTLYAPGGFTGLDDWDRNSACFEDVDLEGPLVGSGDSGGQQKKKNFACANCKRMIEKRPCGFCRK